MQYKFVFFHIPPAYFEEVAIGDEDPRGFTWKASAFRALLAKHKVNEVYMGHIHGYASAVIDGVRYTLSAGAGAPLSDRLPEEARIYHLLVVHVSPGGLSQELVHLVPGTLDCTRENYLLMKMCLAQMILVQYPPVLVSGSPARGSLLLWRPSDGKRVSGQLRHNCT